MDIKRFFYNPFTPRSVLLIRFMVGLIFLSEGIQKFLFPSELGVGRFTQIGIPYSEIMAPFVGAIEIICGCLVVIGLVTKLASIPLLVDIVVAMLSTKIPILMQKGFWQMAHEARTDFCMLIGLIFLLIVGPGKISFDFIIHKYLHSMKNGDTS